MPRPKHPIDTAGRFVYSTTQFSPSPSRTARPMREKRFFMYAALAGALLLALSCTLMGMAAPPSLAAQRATSLARRRANAPHSYRALVQVNFGGRLCLQEIEVRGSDKALVHDTCGSSWLSTLAVPRLFELGARLEHPAECFPSQRNCVCRRLRIGAVEYDHQFGFPGRITWRRELRPNWQHPDYFARLLETRALPNCSSAARSLHLTVISLTPLP